MDPRSKIPPTLCYEIRFNGVVCGYSWGAFRELGPAPSKERRAVRQSRYAFEFWQEAYRVDALAQMPSRLHCRLECTRELVPIRYAIESPAIGKIDTYFAKGKFRVLAQGRLEKTGSCDEVELVLQSNMVPQLAYKLLFCGCQPPFSFKFYSPETMAVAVYKCERDDRMWRTNFGETLVFDDFGCIERIGFDVKEMGVVRVARSLPRWKPLAERGTRPNSALAYSGPRDPKVETRDIALRAPRRMIECTLASPRKARTAYAAALFLGGSGKHNRHGIAANLDVGYHQLLDGLAAQGIISLWFERYGRFNPERADDEEGITLEDLLADAEYCFGYLKRNETTRKLPKVIIGHSLGGTLALMLASRIEHPTAVVAIASPGRPLKNIMMTQAQQAVSDLELSGPSARSILALQQELFDTIENVAEWNIDSIHSRFMAERPNRNLFADLLPVDPIAHVKSLDCPLLIVQGDGDFQVSVDDAESLLQAARIAGVPAHKIVMKGYDHLMKRARGGELTERILLYYDRRRRIPRRFVARLAREIGNIISGCSNRA